MKKISTITASFIAGILFATAASVTFAEDGIEMIKAFVRNDLTIKVNGVTTKFNNNVVSVDGKTYLYLRDFEKFGMKVGWNQQLKQIDIQTVTDVTYGADGTPASSTLPNGQPIPNQPDQTVPSQTVSIIDPNEIWYNDVELQIYQIRNRLKVYEYETRDDGLLYIQYDNKEYSTELGKDVIRDKNRSILFSQSFLLNFISMGDLSALKKYKVDAEGKIYQY